ncbi:MAG TPA: AarF/ABC1/UbiB kinase family protein [Oligoflexus sp.]|uniref:ABC1 kinase family protein n=1 Tax=Oligoflexus sp. TaxID=1971216 RepID=UPI002D6C80CB|nr:AarF/ABC1/UbiB kinase family protein [Oligoflexus sp.]HYX37081.1 AarF/ABC1/UbiB kinase family protein [Oligoflexus sp.]
MTKKKDLKKIKTGFFDRSFSLTKLAIRSSAGIAVSGIKGMLSDADTKDLHFKILLESQARLLANELGILKGSLMKVGQMLALYGEHFFPEEVARTLKTLNEQGSPVAWLEIQKILKKRLTEEVLSELEIDPEPLAAASMGQVHRARIKATGQEICLKIQYPGVDKAIDTDIKALRSILGMMKIIPTHSDGYEQLFQEIRTMLKQELDYERELHFTEQARELLKDQKQFIIPQCHARYSAKRVLATTYEPGFNIDSPEVQGLPQDRKNRLGENFSWLFIHELFHFRMMQTDPHFGNYKVRIHESGEDQLVLLDWGAVRNFETEFVNSYRRMLEGALTQNREMMIQAGLEVGFLRADDNEKLRDSFAEICSVATEPWLPPADPRVPAPLVDGKGCYLWSRSDLPTRITQLATRYALSFKMRPPPREVLFLDRKIGGVFIILKILDARFQGHKLLAELLPRG